MAYSHHKEIITPKRSWFDVRLKELWNYRDLIWLFVKRDFVAQYKQTILGPIWFVIQPIITALVFYVIFQKIAHIPTQEIHPFLFYFSGLSLWGFFSDGLTKTSSTFISNAHLFGKVYFPRLAVPISVIISGSFKLLIHFIILFLLMGIMYFQGIYKWHLDWTLLWVPIYLILLSFLSLGLGILFSALTTKYRDLNFLLTFGVQLWMYATPIIYPLSFTSGFVHKLIQFNPLTSVVENLRFSLFGVGSFDATGLAYTTGCALFVLALGIVVFNRVEQSFMDTV